MDYTKWKGNVTELLCMVEFMKLGYDVSVPYGNASKYDFIADVNGKLLRIQCKSSHVARDHGREDENAFSFSMTTQTSNTKKNVRKRYTSEDIDYFATYYDGNVYLIPVEEEAHTSKTLRLTSTNKGNFYNDAKDYLLENVLGVSETLKDSTSKFINRKDLIATKCYCKNCGKEISNGSIYCTDCSHLAARKVVRPDKDELKALIRTKSFAEIARDHNVSDKTITKWCKGYNLPHTKKVIASMSDEEWSKI